MLKNWFILALLIAASPGCGTDSPYDYIPVRGKVSYEDGSPIPAGGLQLRFTALDAPEINSMRPRPAQASLNAQGEFDAVTSHKYGDGLIPGKHRVTILNGTDQNGKSIVPEEYTTSDSPLIVDTASLPLIIKVPKP